MRVLVLGAGGFLGQHLTNRLMAHRHINGAAIDQLTLFDVRELRTPADPRFTVVTRHGDMRDHAVLDELFDDPVDIIFHFAATLTVEAERDFRRGVETNVLGLMGLLERCRWQSRPPKVLFASSIATFGSGVPAVVGDEVLQAPTTSYGTHKAIAELLLADYSRHGFIDGRALRLPIVVTHPGPASGSISDQVAALIREPLRGRKHIVCRIAPDTQMVLASVDNVINGFLRLASVPEDAIGPARAMNLPGITVTPAEIMAAVRRHMRSDETVVCEWQSDPQVQRVMDAWPKAFTSERGLALGLTPDSSADALIASFLANEPARS